jgi:hypothetical protein
MEDLAADGIVGDPTSLIQFGVLGVILMLVLFGFLWAKPSVDRLIADKEKAEQQRDDLMETFQTQVIPVLAEVKDRVVPGINSILSEQQRLNGLISSISREDFRGRP